MGLLVLQFFLHFSVDFISMKLFLSFAKPSLLYKIFWFLIDVKIQNRFVGSVVILESLYRLLPDVKYLEKIPSKLVSLTIFNNDDCILFLWRDCCYSLLLSFARDLISLCECFVFQEKYRYFVYRLQIFEVSTVYSCSVFISNHWLLPFKCSHPYYTRHNKSMVMSIVIFFVHSTLRFGDWPNNFNLLKSLFAYNTFSFIYVSDL